MTPESMLDDVSFSVDFDDDYSNEQEFERDTQFLLTQDSFCPGGYPYPLLVNRWHSYSKQTAKSIGKRSYQDDGYDRYEDSTGLYPFQSSSYSEASRPYRARQQRTEQAASQSDPRPRKRQKFGTTADKSHGWGWDARDQDLDPAEAEYQDISYSRFDPRFLNVKLKGGHKLRQRIELAASTFSHHLLLPRSQNFLNQPKNWMYSGQLCLDLKDLFDELGRVLYGGDRVRTVVSYDRRLPHLANVLKAEDRPGLVIKRAGDRTLHERRLEQSQIRSPEYWTHVKMTGEVRQSLWSEGNSHARSAGESPIPSMLRHMGALVQHSLLTRRVYAFTVCGAAFRLWTADSNSFASSRIFDFRNLQHRAQLIETLAFVLYPGDEKEERWLPSSIFDVESGHTGSKKTIQTGPAELLDVRGDLFGSRTTVWSSEKLVSDDQRPRKDAPSSFFKAESAGSPFQDLTNEVPLRDSPKRATSTEPLQRSERLDPLMSSPPQGRDNMRVVTKATWIPAEAVHHEEKMLHILHTAEAVALYPLAAEISSTVSISRIAKPIGHIQDELLSRWNAESAGKNAPVRLSILVTQCPVGRNLATAAGIAKKFSLRNWGQIFLGILECLWFSSSKGVHYRDLDLGNVMWAWMPDGKTVVAWLVDWGNARHLQIPRRVLPSYSMTTAEDIRLAGDDGTSANPYFRSIACEQAGNIMERYLDLEQRYMSYSKDIQAKGVDPETDRGCRLLRREMDKDVKDARQAFHRYIDDLQSLIYLIYYVMSLEFGDEAMFKRENLGIAHLKAEQWEQGCRRMFNALKCGPVWRAFMRSGVKLIRDAREKLDQLETLPDELHSIENDCFHALHRFTKETLGNLPGDILPRYT